MEKYRNTISHGRELLSYQHNIIDGIVGDLKTQLVLYRSKNENPDDYFIKILKASDNYGNIWDHTTHDNDIKILPTNTILHVGDSLEFIINSYNPKGGQIKYRFSKLYTDGKIHDSNVLTLTITNEMIRKTVGVEIYAFVETDYVNSDKVIFCYTILP